MNSKYKRLFFYGKGIRARSIAAFVCMGILPFLVAGVYLSWHSFSIQKEQITEHQSALTKLAAQSVSSIFHEHKHLAEAYVRINFQTGIGQSDLESKLREFLAVSWDGKHDYVFNEAYVLDAHGNQLASVSRVRVIAQENLINLSKTTLFNESFNKQLDYFGPIYIDQILMEPVMKVALPIVDIKTGQSIGVFVAIMKFKSVWNVIAQLGVDDQGDTYIVDKDGVVVGHKNPSVVLSNFQLTSWQKVGLIAKSDELEVIQTVERIEYGGHPLHVVIDTPTDIAYAHLYREFIAIAIFFVVALCGAIIVGLYILRKLVVPIEEISTTALEIAQGNYTKRANYSHNDELGDLVSAFNVMTDNLVGAVKRIEHEKAFVQSAIEALTHPFIVRDAKNLNIVLKNSAAQAYVDEDASSGFATPNGTSAANSYSDAQYSTHKVINTRNPASVERTSKDKFGKTKYYEVNAYPVFNRHNDVTQVIEYIVDVTEKKELESQLRQAKKLEAMGRLAGSVAHDFNNLLTGVIGYAELTLKKLPANSTLRNGVELILESGEKGAELTGQLLAFSRNSALEKVVINPADFFDKNINILKGMVGDGVKLNVKVDNGIWNIKADARQISQLFINLSTNACDAMHNQGVLTINASNIILTNENVRFYEGLSVGNYVKIVVEDTGAGMSKEVMERVFEPFFTTKRQSGTGLGMAIVYGVVKQHGGFIGIHSEEGKGTQISILFPATEEVVENAEQPQLVPQHRGDEVVLVVDDDENVVKLIKDVLIEYGYTVHTALSGDETLNLCAELNGKIDLLLVDVVISEMIGRELVDEINRQYPSIKALFMSGHHDEVLANYRIVKGQDAIIAKPIRVEALLSSIRSILNGCYGSSM